MLSAGFGGESDVTSGFERDALSATTFMCDGIHTNSRETLFCIWKSMHAVMNGLSSGDLVPNFRSALNTMVLSVYTVAKQLEIPEARRAYVVARHSLICIGVFQCCSSKRP